MSTRWSEEKIWKWYNSRPWIRGCNYMSADCANRIDQWQEFEFEKRLETTEKELALMSDLGYNSIRVIIEFDVWHLEHDGFMNRFEEYITLCAKYGISLMVVLANDCMRPKESEVNVLGKQHVDWGYHGGRKVSQHGIFSEMGYHILDDPELTPKYFEMVREIVEKYKDDERIIVWDAYNEVGANRRDKVSLPNLKKIFEIIREINPIQPVTCCTWCLDEHGIEKLSEVQQYALNNSDIISYHNYSNYQNNVVIINILKKLGRPILNTEWLARCINNNVHELFPLFFIEKVGCFNWGFVAGKYQTYEPWNSVWERYEREPNMPWDFTKWFHDLYRANHRPYDPRETDLIKKFCKLADEDFKNKK